MEISNLNAILHIFSLILLAASIVFFNLSYFGTSYNNNFLIKLSQNWKKSPIIDIKNTNTSLCPSGYSNLIYDIWPGTRKGCTCNGILNPEESCGKNCKGIDPLPSSPYNSWNSKQLCVLKLGNNYLDLNLTGKNLDCAQNFKNCGKVDNLGNMLCININHTCPINKLFFLNNDNLTTSDNYSYSNVNFGNNKTLYFTNQNTADKPLIGFKISENIPCIDPSFENQVYPKSPLDFYYKKDKCFNQFYGKFTDPSYSFLDSSNYLDLLTQNNIFNLLQKLPDLSNNNFNYNINMYSYNGYIGINISCYQNIIQQKLNSNFLDSLNYLADFTPSVSLFYIGIIILYISFLFFLVYIIFLLIHKFGRLNKNCLIVSFVFSAISLIFSIISLILYSFYFDQIIQAYVSYNILSPFLNCGDSEFNYEVKSLKATDVFIYTLIALIFLIFLIFLHTLLFFWYAKLLRQEISNLNKVMENEKLKQYYNNPEENNVKQLELNNKN